jgi:hypothetical protein
MKKILVIGSSPRRSAVAVLSETKLMLLNHPTLDGMVSKEAIARKDKRKFSDYISERILNTSIMFKDSKKRTKELQKQTRKVRRVTDRKEFLSQRLCTIR